MKIRFGTINSGRSPALVLGFTAFLIGYWCMHFQMRRSWSHDLILEYYPSNVTSTIFNRHCGLPYDDYRCSVLSITPNISKFCLNDAQIASIRLLPLLSFALQVWLIYELFSLSEDCVRFFLYAIGVTSVFIFAGITIVTYHDTCAQPYITMFLFLTSGILFMLVIRDLQIHQDRRRVASNRCPTCELRLQRIDNN
jgi:hypothetical protein